MKVFHLRLTDWKNEFTGAHLSTGVPQVSHLPKELSCTTCHQLCWVEHLLSLAVISVHIILGKNLLYFRMFLGPSGFLYFLNVLVPLLLSMYQFGGKNTREPWLVYLWLNQCTYTRCSTKREGNQWWWPQQQTTKAKQKMTGKHRGVMFNNPIRYINALMRMIS